eukprot:Em0006g297a
MTAAVAAFSKLAGCLSTRLNQPKSKTIFGIYSHLGLALVRANCRAILSRDVIREPIVRDADSVRGLPALVADLGVRGLVRYEHRNIYFGLRPLARIALATDLVSTANGTQVHPSSKHLGSLATCLRDSAATAAAPAVEQDSSRMEGLSGDVTVISKAAGKPFSHLVTRTSAGP